MRFVLTNGVMPELLEIRSLLASVGHEGITLEEAGILNKRVRDWGAPSDTAHTQASSYKAEGRNVLSYICALIVGNHTLTRSSIVKTIGAGEERTVSPEEVGEYCTTLVSRRGGRTPARFVDILAISRDGSVPSVHRFERSVTLTNMVVGEIIDPTFPFYAMATGHLTHKYRGEQTEEEWYTEMAELRRFLAALNVL